MNPPAGPGDRIFEPTVDWIGDCPVSHGERDVDYGAADYGACLCGVRDYAVCPARSGEGTIWDLVIGPA